MYWHEFKKIKSVAYSSQGSHTGQLDFCNWLASWQEYQSKNDDIIIIIIITTTTIKTS